MTDQLNVSNLRSVLEALRDFTEIHQLGIELCIDLAKIREIEKNYPVNCNRQKTEVIDHWLRNSQDASWTTLANAIEKMGGHADLVERLRSRPAAVEMLGAEDDEQNGENSQRPCNSIPTEIVLSPDFPSPHICVETCEAYNILLLGKIGHGKSTLGNKMINSGGHFRISNQTSPHKCDGSAVLRSTSRCKDYKINVCDYDGLFEGVQIDTAISEFPKDLKLVIFVLKGGCNFDEDERGKLEAVVNILMVSRISALVLTHCESLLEEEREKLIKQFKKDHQSVAELMGKGILAVGFPDGSHIQSGSELSQKVEDDKKKLKELIYDEKVTIPESDTSSFVEPHLEELSSDEESVTRSQPSLTDDQPAQVENYRQTGSNWLKTLLKFCCCC